MGESKDTLKGSCSQNTLKNKSLEHQSNRQERNFTDRDRHTETYMEVWKAGASLPPAQELGNIYIYNLHSNIKNSSQWNLIGPFLVYTDLLYLLVLWPRYFFFQWWNEMVSSPFVRLTLGIPSRIQPGNHLGPTWDSASSSWGVGLTEDFCR
jgi:hypothetical protein